MTTLRDAAQQALEALKDVDGPITALLGGLLGSPDKDAPGAKVRAAITALHTALEQDEPEGFVCARCGALAFDPLVPQQAMKS